MDMIWLDEVGSTNSYLKENVAHIPPMTLVIARKQTAGRGQRGNHWEAQDGLNLTFSLRICPVGFRPSEQFIISEATALAMSETLRDYGISACVKWPNDIYVSDKKICGILIENSITESSITNSIIGIGLNVNQRSFSSWIPNPTSMTLHMKGETLNLHDVACKAAEKLEKYYSLLHDKERLHKAYTKILWRNDGQVYKFYDCIREEPIEARIHSIDSTGHLTLKLSSGEKRRYAFKEVEHIL